ncbi:glycerophosphoryl diester phosphodiesterase [Sphaerochaeta pleomorpha str. Grapes]|uniref:Glycerophosphoryl diester phosphodiesterase n=1 Tax=Sphaerochaeta pleomorpha (strain ATCC BAA-1885 / DSM 22778 / Grapes) TaxID=158190 RepID=G8QRD1_SPHPG|nr:glycerophosphodiester phosphodiesterase [Sphaerochaeta pleomorpha]AEV28784.1 glycerophosphoryl diester phosphodiesterase [Sphaerochaeta pleomorpha str. Grapes]
MKTVGHRGFSGRYPENTMLSFKKAYEVGCDGIELDVHLSKDGQLVVIHDEMLDRTTNAKGFVRDYTLSELRQIHAGSVFGDTYGFTGIPSFEEYCQWVSPLPIFTNVEIKTNLYYYTRIEEKLIAMVRNFHLEEKVIFSSFNHPTVLRAKQIAPEIACGLLVGKAGMGNIGYYAQTFGMEYYHPDFNSLTEETVQDCKEHGIGLNVWTVDDMKSLEQVTLWGVNGVITDFPDIVAAWVKQK